MGLFTDIKDYGGEYTIEFNQGSHPFIENQQKRLIMSDQGRKALLLENGVCAAMSLNWLEFQEDHPGDTYPLRNLEEKESTQIDHIVEVQVAVRDTNTRLELMLPSFGPKLTDNVVLEESDEQNMLMNMLMEPGIKTISFQADNGKSHVAVAFVTKVEGGVVFKLFDAARGEIQFKLKSDFHPTGEKNPFTWLQAYMQTYRKIYNDEVSTHVGKFTNQWASKESRTMLHEIVKQQNNSQKITESKVEKQPIKLSKMRYSIYQSPKVQEKDAPKPSLGPG